MDEIDDIMDNFDFAKVRECMELLNWKWVNHDDGGFEVPKTSIIKKTARRLMQEAMDSSKASYSVGTGGFQVDKTTEENKVYLSLSFVLTSWDNYA